MSRVISLLMEIINFDLGTKLNKSFPLYSPLMVSPATIPLNNSEQPIKLGKTIG